MSRKQQQEMESWVAQWPVGSKGLFGGRVKETVKVVGATWERGFPTLELVATTGHTYYCKYGMRHSLQRVEATLNA